MYTKQTNNKQKLRSREFPLMNFQGQKKFLPCDAIFEEIIFFIISKDIKVE